MFELIAHKGKWASRRLAAGCGRWLAAVAVVSLLSASTARAGVAIYQNVFEGGFGYSYYTGERCFDCHAYGPWGIPSLTFSVDCDINGSTKTIVLTAQDTQWPIVELDTPAPEFDNVNWDGRAAWFITTGKRTKVSVSNTVYRSSVFKDEGTGRNIPEAPYSFTIGAYDTQYLYLCFGNPNGTTVGWVEISIYDSYNVWIEGSCIATGVKSLQVGTTTYTVYPESLLEGGVRQLDIYVDGSAAAGGTGLSWASPFKAIQEAVDAVRLDGTTVHVKPGVYGPATFDKTKFYENGLSCTITVESTDGPEKTIINGGGLEVSADGNSAFSASIACFSYGDDLSTRYNDIVRGFTLHSSLYGVENGRVENCIISNCFQGVRGSSAYNCLIVGNARLGYGGWVLQNCTVTGNGIGVTAPYATNSVIYGNAKECAYDSSFKYVTNCCIPVVSITDQNNVAMVGPGNIMKAPRFVDAAAGDYRLRPDSPCIDAGNGGTAVGATDLSGGMRVRGAGVDIGCFEFVPTVSDTNATDGVVVPPEWLEAHYGLDRAASPDAAYQAASLAETANLRDGTASGGRLSAWESYLWDLDPTDSSQYPHAEIEMVDGVPRVQIVPSSPNRSYTLLGKDSLNVQNWARSPDLADADFLSTNRFFKVSVELK